MGDWNAEEYKKSFSFVPAYGRQLIELIEGENLKILDLGCGNGALTNELAERGHDVTGLDSSRSQLALARKTYPGLRFIEADATNFSTDEKFDCVFSNAALHWIDEEFQPRMLDCVSACLKEGGQFVFEMGGYGNNELIHGELERQFTLRGLRYKRPFFFPTVTRYAGMLEEAGLAVTFAKLFPRPTPLEGKDGLTEWMKMFVRAPFEGLAEDIADDIRRRTAEVLKEKLYHDGIWYSDYVRLRMRAVKI